MPRLSFSGWCLHSSEEQSANQALAFSYLVSGRYTEVDPLVNLSLWVIKLQYSPQLVTSAEHQQCLNQASWGLKFSAWIHGNLLHYKTIFWGYLLPQLVVAEFKFPNLWKFPVLRASGSLSSKHDTLNCGLLGHSECQNGTPLIADPTV